MYKDVTALVEKGASKFIVSLWDLYHLLAENDGFNPAYFLCKTYIPTTAIRLRNALEEQRFPISTSAPWYFEKRTDSEGKSYLFLVQRLLVSSDEDMGVKVNGRQFDIIIACEKD
jgi:hypothetical protein